MVGITRIGRQTTISALARSLFPDLEDGESLRRAEEALVGANPQLRTRAGFRPEAPVIVPTLSAAKPGRAGSRETADAAAALGEMARGLDALGRAAQAAFAQEQKAAKEATKTLGSAEARDAMRKRYPDLADDLPVLAGLLAERAKVAAARSAVVDAAIGRAQRDLAALGEASARRHKER